MTARAQFVWKVFFLSLLFIVITKYSDGEEKVTYIHTEHPRVEYFNNKFFKYFNLTSRRHNRNNKIYYVDLFAETKVPIDNNIVADFYFYQWLTNQYHRSFVEMHFRFCDLIHKDKFFGAAMKQGKLDAPCPYPPDKYELYNMSIMPEAIPSAFPFVKGRIVANATNHKEHVFYGYIDFEIRQAKVKNRSKNSKL